MLSRNQFAVLRAVNLHPINVSHMGKYKDPTLYWLFRREYLVHEKGYVHLTEQGEQALEEYTHAKIPLRKQAADITERTARYLRVAQMKRRA